MSKITKEWFYAAIIRAIRTMAQVMLSMITVNTVGGVAVADVNWLNVLSVTLVSGLCSLLTSVSTSLPELKTQSTDITQEP